MNNTASLQLPADMIEALARERLNAAIVETLGGSEKLVKTMIDDLMQTGVDYNGKMSRSSSDKHNYGTWLGHVAKKILETEIEGMMREWFQENKDSIRAELGRHLATKKMQKSVSEALIGSLIEQAGCKYSKTFKISFEVAKKED